jgi:hypothetical protein
MAILLRQNTDANNFLDIAGIARTQANAPIVIGICQLTSDLKQYGIWDKMKAVYPMVGQAGVSSSFEVNLKNPNKFRGTFTGGWTFSSTGATPDGTTGYMNTGFTPSGNLVNNSVNLTFYSRTNSAEDTYAMGFAGNSSYGLTAMNLGRTNFVGYSNMNTYFPYLQVTTTTTSLGFFQFSRTTDTRAVAFQNSSSIGTLTSTTNGDITLVSAPLFVGCRNSNGTPIGFSSYQCAFASIGDGLTDTEAANFYTAVQRFQTTLGRQV